MIYARQVDGSVWVDRETLAASLGLDAEVLRGRMRRRRVEPVGRLDDPTVLDPRHRSRAVFDLDAVSDALLGIVARPRAA